MDFTWFIANAERIEPALKSGLYIVQQSRIPPEHQAFRCGLEMQRNVLFRVSKAHSRVALPRILTIGFSPTPRSLRV